jgi:cell division protein FtsW (lipid II flippase)
MLIASFNQLVLVLISRRRKSVKGSARWLSIGFIGIQPSEW